jgi:exodeoxyribonuclease V gamma subunit
MPRSRLKLYTSNRLEVLARQLGDVLALPLSSVFETEIVVVQSAGIGRWLSLELAARQGVCANVRFPFPQSFIGDIFRSVLPGAAGDVSYDRDALTWRIMKSLPPLLEQPEFEEVAHYIRGEQTSLRKFQLAAQIARVFDQYIAFRPQMMRDWDAGKEQHWQAILWRELSRATPDLNHAAIAETLRESAVAELPQRVSIFGIATLPKFYLDLIEALATRVETHLFVMEPTPEWWQDIVSEKTEARILRKHPEQTAADLHLERGNALLASMGKLGREFLGLVADLTPAEHAEKFIEPAGENMLASLQRDIFQLRDPGIDGAKIPIPPNDNSLQFHSCHSAMREMEVLHDQLLALFDRDPTLKPKDIVVMVPDVAAYAPFVEAVFDAPEDEALRIPFSIADRGARAESGIADTFLRILEMAGSRFGVSSVLGLLECVAVQQRFDLSEADLPTIRVWMDKTGIRWGIDAEHRTKFDLPAFGQNSWREGLDRLLLGYALPGGGEQLFEGILPYDEIEGDLAATLGNFVAFATALFETAAELERPRTLPGWQETLRDILQRFFASSDLFERELLQVRRAIDTLGELAATSGFDEEIPRDVLLAYLAGALENIDTGSGYLAGRVTFSALKPLRSIPFRIVCLAGMNDTAFPRHGSAPSFDLVAKNPKAGDRSTRDDDRYLFLESLLSARDVFYVSYVGQSIRDNSVLPPSVLVSELLDYAARAFETGARPLVVRHRLQAFNADYFRPNENLFSYSADNCRASEIARQPRSHPPAFISAPIAKPEEEWRRVELSTLIEFFKNPARFFIQHRIGIRFPSERGTLEEREPFALDPLAKYQIEQDLLAKTIAGANLAEAWPLLQASGQLAPGHVGDVDYRKLCTGVRKFAEVVALHAASESRPPFSVDLQLDAWTLTGRIDGLTAKGLVQYRFAKLKPQDMLGLWIAHLVLNCAEPSEARLMGEGERHTHILQRYPPVEKSRDLLRNLLEIYWRGLREPLRFFPRSSLAFAKATLDPERKREPREAALAEWESDDERFRKSESADAYFDLAFRNVEAPLDAEWEKLSLQIFEPLLAACQEEKL